MKTANVSLKSVRNEFKLVTGSVSFCIKTIYGAIADEKIGSNLAKVLPKSRKVALEECTNIYNWGRVGQTRVTKRTNKDGLQTEVQNTIKASVDMVLRYFVAKYNGTLNK